MFDDFLPIPDAESLPFYHLALKLVVFVYPTSVKIFFLQSGITLMTFSSLGYPRDIPTYSKLEILSRDSEISHRLAFPWPWIMISLGYP